MPDNHLSHHLEAGGRLASIQASKRLSTTILREDRSDDRLRPRAAREVLLCTAWIMSAQPDATVVLYARHREI
jgi:hypothetical protein